MLTYTRRCKAAQKAANTARARREFRNAYPETADIAEDLLKGYSTSEVADDFEIEVTSVAAVLANLNRDGNFADMAEACNF